jgi:hypothetical protein
VRAWRLLFALGLPAVGGACASADKKCPELPAPPECPACDTGRPAAPPIAIPATTLPTDRARKIRLEGFSQDGATALLRVEDAAVGSFLQTVDLAVTPVPKLVKSWQFQDLTEPVAYQQALRALKPQAAGPQSARNAAGVMLLAADAGERVLVLASKGERAVPIAALPRLRDADGLLADVGGVKLAWDPSGRRALVIHGQRLLAAPGFESQWLHVIEVDPATLPF